eukprot:6470402-Amphidinium_carterae.1
MCIRDRLKRDLGISVLLARLVTVRYVLCGRTCALLADVVHGFACATPAYHPPTANETHKSAFANEARWGDQHQEYPFLKVALAFIFELPELLFMWMVSSKDKKVERKTHVMLLQKVQTKRAGSANRHKVLFHSLNPCVRFGTTRLSGQIKTQ